MKKLKTIGTLAVIAGSVSTALAENQVKQPITSKTQISQETNISRLTDLSSLERVKEFEKKGDNNSERGKILEAMLKAEEIPYNVHTYDGGDHKNYLFEIGKGSKTIVFTAHYDTVPGSPGANDDASCISSMFVAYEQLKDNPPKNIKVQFAVFDQEEIEYGGQKGTGSMKYLNDPKTNLNNVVGAISLEFCGEGDLPFIWDLRDKVKSSNLYKNTKVALDQMEIPYRESGPFGTRWSDHTSFWTKDIPAFGMVILPSQSKNSSFDANDYRRYLIGRIIHSSKDVSARLSNKAMQTIGNAVYSIVQTYDKIKLQKSER